MPRASTHDVTTIRRVRRLLDDAGASLVGRRVLVMCSGGADSVALVAILGALPRGAAPRSIDVLWVDHGLREHVERERDAARAAADHVDATFHEVAVRLLDGDVGDDGGVEAAARQARYDVAGQLAATLGCELVCTGHTATDQLEQALLALIGITGRAGSLDAMPVRRTTRDGKLHVVRPLLALARGETEQACRAAGLAWVDDPTNDDPDAHARNGVRHRVVPELLAVGPDAGVAVARAAQRARDDRGVAPALAEALLGAWSSTATLDVRRLAPLPLGARRELVAAWLRTNDLGRRVSTRSVEAVERLATQPARAACARVELGRNACVRRDGYDLTIQLAPRHGGPRP